MATSRNVEFAIRLAGALWRFCRRHRLTDTVEALGDRLTFTVEKVTAEVLPATDTADDPVGWYGCHATVDRRSHAAGILHRLLEAASSAVRST